MKKKPHSAEFKFKAAIEAIRGEKTTAELCQQYGIVSSQLFKWKKALLDNGQEVFKNGTPTKDQGEVEIEKLHATIGRLTLENSFFSQSCREVPMKVRQDLVKSKSRDLSKRSRAKLLDVNLSSCYVKPKAIGDDTIMNEIREIYTMRPFQGYRRITWDLKDLGYLINRKKVYRLMKLMWIEAVYPKKNLSKRNHEYKVFPYLLKERPPLKPHDVWCVDITYIKIATGFIYLTALIDVVSRHVMGWHVSTSLDTESCLRALEMAIGRGYKPKIINSDQGSQFTSQEWIYQLKLLEVRISMDGKGRALDNMPIERFWRTVKYEEVYLNTYESVREAKTSLDAYIHWYNHSRRHSGINDHRPYEVMSGKVEATRWAFMPEQKLRESKEIQACGYVEKSSTFPRDPQGPTTGSNILMVKEKKEIKQQKKVKQEMNLSSKIAA